MRLLLNLLWFIFGGGFIIVLEYLLGGLLLCLTLVGTPSGLQCFKLAGLGSFPFGKDIAAAPDASVIGCVLNVFWLVMVGVWIFLSHIALAVSLALSLIGLPFAFQHLKRALLALTPFGKRVRKV